MIKKAPKISSQNPLSSKDKKTIRKQIGELVTCPEIVEILFHASAPVNQIKLANPKWQIYTY